MRFLCHKCADIALCVDVKKKKKVHDDVIRFCTSKNLWGPPHTYRCLLNIACNSGSRKMKDVKDSKRGKGGEWGGVGGGWEGGVASGISLSELKSNKCVEQALFK